MTRIFTFQNKELYLINVRYFTSVSQETNELKLSFSWNSFFIYERNQHQNWPCSCWIRDLLDLTWHTSNWGASRNKLQRGWCCHARIWTWWIHVEGVRLLILLFNRQDKSLRLGITKKLIHINDIKIDGLREWQDVVCRRSRQILCFILLDGGFVAFLKNSCCLMKHIGDVSFHGWGQLPCVSFNCWLTLYPLILIIWRLGISSSSNNCKLVTRTQMVCVSLAELVFLGHFSH